MASIERFDMCIPRGCALRHGTFCGKSIERCQGALRAAVWDVTPGRQGPKIDALSIGVCVLYGTAPLGLE
jgi:hypothetical protein